MSTKQLSNPICFDLFAGFSAAAYTLVGPLYISEIAESSIRGALALLVQIMVSLGILYVDILNINGFADWVVISGIRIFVPSNYFMP